MVKFEDVISNTCKKYYEENPELKPSKLAQIQYMINGYGLDASNPLPLKDVIEYIQNNVTPEDDFYDDCLKFIENVNKSISDFKTYNPDYIYIIDNGCAVCKTFEDVERYINREFCDEDLNASNEFIDIYKTLIYDIDKDTDNCFEDLNFHMVVNLNKEIVVILDSRVGLYYSLDEDVYPELTKYQAIYLPYKPGDIMSRKADGHFSKEYFYSVSCFMMLYDFNIDHSKCIGDERFHDIQVSMGLFKGRKFDYSHTFCFFEFDILDIDKIIEEAKTDFKKRYFSNIKDISMKIKDAHLDFNNNLNIATTMMNKFAGTIKPEEDCYCE